MSTVVEEQILVIPTALFHELGYFQGFAHDVARYLPRLLEGDHIEYRPRWQMEEDPDFKQLIPYLLFRWTDSSGQTYLFEYQRGRGQGERRLHAKRSVGVGGHISTLDVNAALSLRERKLLAEGNEYAQSHVYRQGMRRELDEEVKVNAPFKEKVVGLINDDETPVGRVHLGIVHVCDVEQPDVSPREDEILDAGFRPVGDILKRLDEFESWSEIVVRALFG